MSALRNYDALNQIHTGAALKDAGAGSVTHELVRGQKIALNFFAPGQGASNDGQLKQEMTPESKKRLNAAMAAPRFTPRQAMHHTLSRLADPRYAPLHNDRSVTGEMRAQARDWVRTNNLMLRQTMNRGAITDPQVRNGFKLSNAIKPKTFDRLDPSGELRHSLSQKVGKEARKEQRFNPQQTMARLQQPNIRPTSTRTMSVAGLKNPYALLKSMAPKPGSATLKVAQAGMDLMAFAVDHASADIKGGPSRPGAHGRQLGRQLTMAPAPAA